MGRRKPTREGPTPSERFRTRMEIVAEAYPLSVARWTLGAREWTQQELLDASAAGTPIAHITGGVLEDVTWCSKVDMILAREDGDLREFGVINCFEVLPEER